MMRILMLGAGGIGGYFGARWIQAGADVGFLVRPARQARLRAEGLVVQTPRERFSVPVTTYTRDRIDGEFDLIVLSPKAYDLDDAIDSVRDVAGRPLLLPLLNGLDHLDVLDREFGRERVMGGVAHIAATLSDDGVVVQLGALHRLTFGHRHPGQLDMALALERLGRNAAFDSQRSDDIVQVLWDKWVFLATLAGMTTLLRAAVGQIVAAPGGDRASREMYETCCAVAAHHGHPIRQSARDEALAMLLAPGSPFTASMLRDLQAGRRTEHEHILGAMVRRADAAGIACPGLRLAYLALAIAQAEGRAATGQSAH